jgi:hypothetical protein
MMRLLPVKITIREHPLGIVTDAVIENVLRRIDRPSPGSAARGRYITDWTASGRALYPRGVPVFFRPGR